MHSCSQDKQPEKYYIPPLSFLYDLVTEQEIQRKQNFFLLY